jgi:hypothetical protein
VEPQCGIPDFTAVVEVVPGHVGHAGRGPATSEAAD